jgi:hypothetical protein
MNSANALHNRNVKLLSAKVADTRTVLVGLYCCLMCLAVPFQFRRYGRFKAFAACVCKIRCLYLDFAEHINV